MSWLWASVTILVAAKIGWNSHDIYADWRRKRNAQWVTIRLANGMKLTARVEDIDWGKFFDVEDLVA